MVKAALIPPCAYIPHWVLIDIQKVYQQSLLKHSVDSYRTPSLCTGRTHLHHHHCQHPGTLATTSAGGKNCHFFGLMSPVIILSGGDRTILRSYACTTTAQPESGPFHLSWLPSTPGSCAVATHCCTTLMVSTHALQCQTTELSACTSKRHSKSQCCNGKPGPRHTVAPALYSPTSGAVTCH